MRHVVPTKRTIDRFWLSYPFPVDCSGEQKWKQQDIGKQEDRYRYSQWYSRCKKLEKSWFSPSKFRFPPGFTTVDNASIRQIFITKRDGKLTFNTINLSYWSIQIRFHLNQKRQQKEIGGLSPPKYLKICFANSGHYVWMMEGQCNTVQIREHREQHNFQPYSNNWQPSTLGWLFAQHLHIIREWKFW